MSTHKRVFAAVFALATIGYFDYTYKLPRLTLVTTKPILLVLLPTRLVWLRRPDTDSQRTIIVGDNFEQIARITQKRNLSLLGYLCPTPTLSVSSVSEVGKRGSEASVVSDDGYDAIGINRLGGLLRSEETLVEHDIDAVVLAFAETDRAEFFGGG